MKQSSICKVGVLTACAHRATVQRVRLAGNPEAPRARALTPWPAGAWYARDLTNKARQLAAPGVSSHRAESCACGSLTDECASASTKIIHKSTYMDTFIRGKVAVDQANINRRVGNTQRTLKEAN